MEYLSLSKNNENIHGGSHNNIEAPRDFSLNFWKVHIGSKNRIELNQLWIPKFISYFGKKLPLTIIYKNIFLELPGQFGNSRIMYFANLSFAFGLVFGKFASPF